MLQQRAGVAVHLLSWGGLGELPPRTMRSFIGLAGAAGAGRSTSWSPFAAYVATSEHGALLGLLAELLERPRRPVPRRRPCGRELLDLPESVLGAGEQVRALAGVVGARARSAAFSRARLTG